MSYCAWAILGLISCVCVSVSAAGLDSLRAGHPRLLVMQDDIARIRQLIESNAVRELSKRLRSDAEKCLEQPLVEYKLIGPRLLSVSKEAQRRIWTLAGIYRLTGERKFADRAIREMLHVCAFKDWNPSHFLDTAEMCAGVAVGYDWLFVLISPEDRATIRAAVVDLALKPAIGAYHKEVWWTKTENNWAQVCSGGLLLGALAIADDEAELAATILRLTYPSIVRAMQSYAPDGGYVEGPGYWTYATNFNVLYISALQTALGKDLDLPEMQGFAEAGLFRIHTTGPTTKRFNFADCNEPTEPAWCMFWLAKHFNQPAFAAHERMLMSKKPEILHLLWFDGRSADVPHPVCALFKKINVVCIRSDWSSGATFVAIKGGDNSANHAHLDLGSFVLDANAQRWAMDLGRDDYNLPGYFGANRWQYYRLRTEGQNTLLVDGENQPLEAIAPVTAFSTAAGSTTIDLSAAYAPLVKSASRSVVMAGRGTVSMIDRIKLDQPRQIRWTMHTQAKVRLENSGRSALLEIEGRQLRLDILGGGASVFSVEPAKVLAPQRTNDGVSRLMIDSRLNPGDHEIHVTFSAQR